METYVIQPFMVAPDGAERELAYVNTVASELDLVIEKARALRVSIGADGVRVAKNDEILWRWPETP